MNRIYLKQRENGSYWIRDIINGKKLGEINVENNNMSFIIKPKHQHRNIETEARLSFRSATAWSDYCHDFIGYFNQEFSAGDNHDLPVFAEACNLRACENDMFDRGTQLHPAARKAWHKMQTAAKKKNIDLQIISAFRSLDYQKSLIENKLAKGLAIEEILKVNALPGYSEHHTGCAIDIGSNEEPILEDAFENSAAFMWLVENANKFNFTMTYPKGNTTGICYEPWHWCFKPN